MNAPLQLADVHPPVAGSHKSGDLDHSANQPCAERGPVSSRASARTWRRYPHNGRIRVEKEIVRNATRLPPGAPEESFHRYPDLHDNSNSGAGKSSVVRGSRRVPLLGCSPGLPRELRVHRTSSPHPDLLYRTTSRELRQKRMAYPWINVSMKKPQFVSRIIPRLVNHPSQPKTNGPTEATPDTEVLPCV